MHSLSLPMTQSNSGNWRHVTGVVKERNRSKIRIEPAVRQTQIYRDVLEKGVKKIFSLACLEQATRTVY